MPGNKPIYLTEDEAPTKDTILYFNRQEFAAEGTGRQQQMLRILGECPDCHEQRWIRVNSLRNGKIRSTFCARCSKKHAVKALPKEGTQDANGYRMIHLRLLSPEDQELVLAHLKPHRGYVYEHRLVALKTYGPIVGEKGIVVRHMDGDKQNNAPSNLRLGSQGDNVMDHVNAIATMKAWRALALFLIHRLHS